MQVFEPGLGASLSVAGESDRNRGHQVDGLMREMLSTAQRVVADADAASSMSNQTSEADDWEDVGAFVLRTAAVLAEFTAKLQESDFFTQLLKEKAREGNDHHHLADNGLLKRVQEKKLLIRQTNEATAQYRRNLQEIWGSQNWPNCNGTGHSTSSASPYPGRLDFGDKIGGKDRSRRTLPAGGQRDQKSPNDHAPASEASDDSEDELFQGVDMDALANRGKGVYHCPKRERCTKGGVDKDGNLVAFERNSSFVQHCNKHRKPFKCEEEHCPNPPKKRKFARRDGLERHKSTVSHVPPSPGQRRASRHTLMKIEAS